MDGYEIEQQIKGLSLSPGDMANMALPWRRASHTIYQYIFLLVNIPAGAHSLAGIVRNLNDMGRREGLIRRTSRRMIPLACNASILYTRIQCNLNNREIGNAKWSVSTAALFLGCRPGFHRLRERGGAAAGARSGHCPRRARTRPPQCHHRCARSAGRPDHPHARGFGAHRGDGGPAARWQSLREPCARGDSGRQRLRQADRIDTGRRARRTGKPDRPDQYPRGLGRGGGTRPLDARPARNGEGALDQSGGRRDQRRLGAQCDPLLSGLFRGSDRCPGKRLDRGGGRGRGRGRNRHSGL